jgi:hypothetical protein
MKHHEREEEAESNEKLHQRLTRDNIKRMQILKYFRYFRDVIEQWIYTNINGFKTHYGSLKCREMSNADAVPMLSIIEIQDLWNKLYKGTLRLR